MRRWTNDPTDIIVPPSHRHHKELSRGHSGVAGSPEDELAGIITRAFDSVSLPGTLPRSPDT